MSLRLSCRGLCPLGLLLISCSGRGRGRRVGLCGAHQAENMTRSQATHRNRGSPGPSMQLLGSSWGWAGVARGEGCGLEHSASESVPFSWTHRSGGRAKAMGDHGHLDFRAGSSEHRPTTQPLGAGRASLVLAPPPRPAPPPAAPHPRGPTLPHWMDLGRGHGDGMRAQPGQRSGQSCSHPTSGPKAVEGAQV